MFIVFEVFIINIHSFQVLIVIYIHRDLDYYETNKMCTLSKPTIIVDHLFLLNLIVQRSSVKVKSKYRFIRSIHLL